MGCGITYYIVLFLWECPLHKSHKIKIFYQLVKRVFKTRNLVLLAAEKEITVCEITKHLRTLGLVQS